MFSMTKYDRRALTGGIIATVITGAGAFLLGNISGYEAKDLIKSSLPGIDTLCNTIVLASATILALLLTLLSLSSSIESKLKDIHYMQVLRIAKIDTAVFVVSLITFQVFNIPITESDQVPNTWFTYIYYVTLGLSSLLSGGLIGVVLMLYNTVENIIKIVGLKIEDHPLLYTEEDEDKKE
ncbi:hypothetical protein ACH3O9_14925 [Leeuwenhoekiella sp. A16]|uniref:hypothetical protein n=1 Tax=unclassified Leeuwenhoekiella TaxID=2615029 RepID=UPI003A7F935A|tara:strand:- start:1265 stop:1807 length:543 start_codon:yes stop_codon:yes gene_type:complete